MWNNLSYKIKIKTLAELSSCIQHIEAESSANEKKPSLKLQFSIID